MKAKGGSMEEPKFILELDFFKKNQKELVQKYLDKYLVIKGETILGIYENALKAYLESKKKFELGTFMIQHCTAGADAFTISFSSHELIKM